MKKKLKNITLLLWLLLAATSAQKASAAAAANLNQARNGTAVAPTSPVSWVNGNLGGSQAHYNEAMSSPFQCVMTGLSVGVQIYIIIEYDNNNSSKHAYDYLTTYNRILPHDFGLHTTPETIDPLSGTGLTSGTPYITYPIPAPSSAGSPTSGQPTLSFNTLPDTERVMTLYNGTIDSVYYLVQGSLTASQSSTQIKVVFTPSSATAVLLWGGHLGSRGDWGYTSGSPNSAGGVSGSPFHMRLISWSYGSLGSQDRGLAGGAVGVASAPLPVELTDFHVHPAGEVNQVEWTTATEINNSHFTLERSSSLTNFQPLTMVDGAGNCNIERNYSWTDDAPLGGLSYYRLIQTDFDGSQKILGPISVFRNNGLTSLTVVSTYPNPFIDNFVLTYFSAQRAATAIEILDATGKRVWYDTMNADAGANSYHFIDKSLEPGIYFVTLSQGDNNLVSTKIIRR